MTAKKGCKLIPPLPHSHPDWTQALLSFSASAHRQTATILSALWPLVARQTELIVYLFPYLDHLCLRSTIKQQSCCNKVFFFFFHLITVQIVVTKTVFREASEHLGTLEGQSQWLWLQFTPCPMTPLQILESQGIEEAEMSGRQLWGKKNWGTQTDRKQHRNRANQLLLPSDGSPLGPHTVDLHKAQYAPLCYITSHCPCGCGSSAPCIWPQPFLFSHDQCSLSSLFCGWISSKARASPIPHSCGSWHPVLGMWTFSEMKWG